MKKTMRSVRETFTLSKYLHGSHEIEDTTENKQHPEAYSFAESLSPLHFMIRRIAAENKLPLGTRIKVIMKPLKSKCKNHNSPHFSS